MIELLPSRQIFITLFGFSIYWYGVMYLLAFITGYHVVRRLQHHRSIRLTDEQWSSILTWIVVAVIAGGRAGYVLLYAFDEFVRDPSMVFAVRDGGMSSHGGFVAVIACLYTLSKRYRLSLLAFGDIVVTPVAIGLAFGRFGNLINLELYGTVTDLPWAITIPGVTGARHPTQAYAMIKDVFEATLCFLLLRRVPRLPDGAVAGIFLVTYGTLRTVVETFRVETHPGFTILGEHVTRGQAYSVPLIAAGILVLTFAFARRSR